MKVHLKLTDGTKLQARNEDGLPYACVDAPCPACNAPAPFKVSGKGKRIHARDTYAADASAICCGAPLGTLYAQVETLFGSKRTRRCSSTGARACTCPTASAR